MRQTEARGAFGISLRRQCLNRCGGYCRDGSELFARAGCAFAEGVEQVAVAGGGRGTIAGVAQIALRVGRLPAGALAHGRIAQTEALQGFVELALAVLAFLGGLL